MKTDNKFILNEMKTESELTQRLIENNVKLTSLCRVCLAENVDRPVSLFEEKNSLTFCEKVMLCTRVQIRDDDGLPGLICEACAAHLEAADSFRTKCEHSDSVLRDYHARVIEGHDKKIQEVADSSDWDFIKNENAQQGDGHDGKPKVVSDEKNSNRKKKKGISKTVDNFKLIENADCLIDDNIPEGETIVKEEDFDSDREYVDEATVIDSHELLEVTNEIKTEKSKKFECQLCGKPLCSKFSLKSHMKTIHNEKRKFSDKVIGYGPRRMFRCKECDYSTRHSQSLVYHERIHTGEKPYECDVCGRRFSQPGSLSCHKKTHSDKMYFTCALCGKQFKYKETYEKHKDVHIEEKKFTCTICNKGLKSSKTLQGHMNRHYNIKNYSCETCGNTFVTHVELLNHSRKHSEERKYQCNLCDFKTYVKKGLVTHLRRHTGERPFKCDLCELACYTRGELKCHTRKHTKEKNYSCPVCQLRFIHSSSVNKHMLKAHGIKYKRNNTIDRRVVK